ncbi:MAG TPA: MFS transporter [Acidimicrobiales bacterium]
MGETFASTPYDGELVGTRAGAGAEADNVDVLPRRLFTPAFFVVILAGFLYFVGIGAMMPILPRYVEDELGGGGFQVGLAVGTFAVSAALLRPWVGRTGDTHGRRILVIGGAAVAAVSILAYPLATSLPLLMAFRLVTGAGEAAFFTGLVTINQDLAPDDRRGEAASYFSVCLYGGLALGPPLGEALLKATDFTTVFVTFAVACGVGAALSVLLPRGEPVEAAGRRTILHRVALWPGIVAALGLVPITAYGAFLPLYADTVGFEDVGPVLGVYAGLVLVIRIVAARLPDALGWRRASALALSGVALGVGVIGAWGAPAAVWTGTILLAIGMSLLYPALLAAVMNATPEAERSHAVGTFTLFLDLATGLGTALVGIVVSLGNERAGFVVAGLLAASGLVAQTVLRHRIGQPAPAPAPARPSAAA